VWHAWRVGFEHRVRGTGQDLADENEDDRQLVCTQPRVRVGPTELLLVRLVFPPSGESSGRMNTIVNARAMLLSRAGPASSWLITLSVVSTATKNIGIQVVSTLYVAFFCTRCTHFDLWTPTRPQFF
jgi:hypothetical protein